MAAKPDTRGLTPEVSAARPEALGLHWKPVAPEAGGRMSSPGAPAKLAPARGLIVGLLLGALLWLGIGIFAWQFFK